MSALRQYETTYILNPDADETERTKVRERFVKIIEEQFGGSILKIDEWGRRPLAYKMRKESFGFYVHVRYHAAAEAIAEMERILRITDSAMKFLTIRLDDDEELEDDEEGPAATLRLSAIDADEDAADSSADSNDAE